MVECPPNFGMTVSGVYRSSFPRSEHFEFLKTLNLKSILVLIAEPYPQENLNFCQEQGIELFRVPLSGNKEPFVHVDPETIAHALRIVSEPANWPILIHCNQGKHRTGCVVGCFRRMQRWSLSLIFEEYRRYAYPKVRPLDQLMIERFDPKSVRVDIDTDDSDVAWLISLWS